MTALPASRNHGAKLAMANGDDAGASSRGW
jgi:hypothetical protein